MTDWKELSFTDVFDIQGGTQPPKAQFKDKPLKGYVRLLQIRDFGEKPVPTYIPDSKTLKKCSTDDVLIGRYGASVGRICTGMEGAYNVALAKVINKNNIDRDYLRFWLESENFQAPLRLIQRTAQNGFNKDDLGKITFKYPAHQKKQKEIASWIKSSLDEVSIGVSALETSLEHLNIYKQSILNASIRGKLAHQDPTDESASKLLEKIQEEKEKLIAEKKIKKEKPLPEIEDKEIPHELPNRWSWARLGDIVKPGKIITYGIVQAGPHIPDGVPYIRVTDMVGDQLSPIEMLRTSKTIAQKYERSAVDENDIVYALRGRVGDVMKVPKSLQGANLTQGTARISVSSHLSSDYILWALRSPVLIDQANKKAKGSTFKEITLAGLRELLIPVPPRNEQNRIVQKVNSLMQFAKSTEASLENSLKLSPTLKLAILKKAFEGEL